MYEPLTCLACRSLRLAALRQQRRLLHFTRIAQQESATVTTSSSATSNESGHATHGPQSTAAAHLLAQARIEEADLSPFASISSRVNEAHRADVPWQGEESIQDSVLRVLMDKYKPLRLPGHKKQIQQPSSEQITFGSSAGGEIQPVSGQPAPRIYTSDGRIDQSVPGYTWQQGDPPRFPWEHTFRSPVSKDGKPLVRSGSIAPSTSIGSVRLGGTSTHNRSARPTAGEVAARVYRARDASVDYASGSHDAAKAKVTRSMLSKTASARARLSGQTSNNFTPMPTTVRGWTSVIEERIELAKQQGLFKNIKGRGKPIPVDPQENNPFLDRSEFLMNRIVKRQEAAPPFVELQKEVREETQVFRARLRESWVRRALRMICLGPITPAVIEQAGDFRDKEWESRERSYWDISLKNVNELVRKYNIVAPASVRMPLLTVELELIGAYRDCTPIIQDELHRRVKAGLGSNTLKVHQGPKGDLVGKAAEGEEPVLRETLLSAMRRLVKDLVTERNERKRAKAAAAASGIQTEKV